MKSLTERIREAYERSPQASGEQILEAIGTSKNTVAREALVKVQNDLHEQRSTQRFTKGEQSYGVTTGSSKSGHDVSIIRGSDEV